MYQTAEEHVQAAREVLREFVEYAATVNQEGKALEVIREALDLLDQAEEARASLEKSCGGFCGWCGG